MPHRVTHRLAVFVIMSYIICTRMLRADLDRLGPEGQWLLFQEGLMPSFGTFLLTWTLGFTLLH